MRKIKLLLVAALAASTVAVAAPPAQARCHPDLTTVCRAIMTVCDAIDRPCYI